jgi:hypothetical protein
MYFTEYDQRFSQANDTVSLRPDQRQLLGQTRSSPTAYRLLDGYISPLVQGDIKELAPFLSMPSNMRVRLCILNRNSKMSSAVNGLDAEN